MPQKRPDSAATAGTRPESTALSGPNIDSLMENLAHPQGARAAAKSTHPYKRLADVHDCLAADGQGQHGPPSFTSKSPQPKKPRGWTLAGRNRDTKRYLGRALVSRGTESPGPKYQPTTSTNTVYPRNMSFPRERRMLGAGTSTPGPGPAGPPRGYDIPSTLQGLDKTRAASPACRFGTAERFKTVEFISLAHSKSAGVGSALSPGPQEYFIGERPASAGPAHSFGAQGASRGERPRFNTKVFISRAHAAASGPADTRGAQSPAPGQHQPDNRGRDPEDFGRFGPKHPRAPAWTLGGPADGPPPRAASAPPGGRTNRVQYISAEHAAKEPPRDNYPGPGSYFESGLKEEERPDGAAPVLDAASRSLNVTRDKAPSYSFGLNSQSAKRFFSAALAEGGPKGRESPGPCYAPSSVATQRQAPSFSFGPAFDPEYAAETERFGDKRYIGSGIGIPPGGASPGPAEYDVSALEVAQGPAHSFARRERQLMRRICPAPERARFFSKELAKENYGCYSPGPKYAVAGTVGKEVISRNPAGTFGVSDRAWGEAVATDLRERAHSKPYTTPGEARFIGKEHAVSNRGRFGPGPIYNPQFSVERAHPDQSPGSEFAGNSTCHQILSKHRTAPAVSVGKRPTKKAHRDSRDHNPSVTPTKKAAPSFGFGTAARSGYGACQVHGAGKTDKDTKQREDKRNLEVAPGPGSFTPNYASVEVTARSAFLGGLSDAGQPPVPPRKPKPSAVGGRANDSSPRR